jgi:serine/threonine protein kinase
MLCPTCSQQNPDSAAVCRSCGSPLPSQSATPPAPILPTGTKLQNGAFSIGRILGQGGFGITYLGSDLRQRRPVALKEFFPQGSVRSRNAVHPSSAMSPESYRIARDRFMEEARILSRFRHPGIVRVFALFQENNTAYMAMEYLRGQTLQKRIEENGPLEEDEAVGYVRRIGEALSEVHAVQLLHRDIKPENILLSEDHRVTLVDFGSAREFAAGQTKRMTALLTPGYAPLEQYGQQARFGAFTDIYALGATLYHMLTGQPPSPSADRAAGVTLPPPHRVNPKVRREISDAVMWAMEMKVDKRPQSVRDFLAVLNGEKSTAEARPGRRSTTKSPPPAPPQNPYEARLRQLFAEIAQPDPIPSAHSNDGRIRDIEAQLAAMGRFGPQDLTLCPACRKSKLRSLSGFFDGKCPLCRIGPVQQRRLDPDKCPVCRTGRLSEQRVSWDAPFCPICRLMPVRKEKRKRFGFSVDAWWVCGRCQAEFDVVLAGRARLQRFSIDPFGVGRKYAGQTLSFAEWKTLSGRAEAFLICNQCAAQFDPQDQNRLKLAGFVSDPFEVGKKHGGSAFFRLAWAKIAEGLPLAAGNAFCSHCKAEFNEDSSRSTLALLQFDEKSYSRFASLRGKPLRKESWSLLRSGKQSLRAGFLCGSCQTEFDTESQGEKLIRTDKSALAAAVGQIRTLEDWHRWTSGLPLKAEERKLREELHRLQIQRANDQSHPQNIAKRRRQQLEAELQELLKKSLLEGFIAVQAPANGVALRKTERLVWTSAASKLKRRWTQGEGFWEEEFRGTLYVTNERLLLQIAPDKLWQRGLSKLTGAEMQMANGADIGVFAFSDLQRPVGFQMPAMQIRISVGNHSCVLSLGMGDLIRWLNKAPSAP